MALEVKSVNVTNESEEARIKFYQKFGWVLKSSQRVSDHAAGTDFTKLMFERNTGINNYAQICELEQQCYAIAEEIDEMPDYVGQFHSSISIEDWADMGRPETIGKLHWGIGLIGALLGAIWVISTPPAPVEWDAVPGVAFLGFLVFFFVGKKILKKHAWWLGLKFPWSGMGKEMKELYDAMIQVEIEYEKKEERIAELSAQAAALLDE